MSCINYTFPRYVICIQSVYPPHRNLLRFTTVTILDALHKSHRSLLCNMSFWPTSSCIGSYISKAFVFRHLQIINFKEFWRFLLQLNILHWVSPLCASSVIPNRTQCSGNWTSFRPRVKKSWRQKYQFLDNWTMDKVQIPSNIFSSHATYSSVMEMKAADS
jgi:hypothetical protein